MKVCARAACERRLVHAHVRGTHREASDARGSRECARGLARPATKVACNLVKLRMGRKCVKTLRKVVARSLCSTPPERQGSALADPGWRLPFHPHLTATLARAARRRPHMRDDGRSNFSFSGSVRVLARFSTPRDTNRRARAFEKNLLSEGGNLEILTVACGWRGKPCETMLQCHP